MAAKKQRKAVISLLTVLGFALVFAWQSFSPIQANSPATKRIGVLQFADHPSLLNSFDGLIAGLEDENYVVGQNLEVNYQVAKADMALNMQMASQMAAENYDLVVGIATPSAQALYNAVRDRNIPLVFNAVTDPIAAGLANLGDASEGPADDDYYKNIPGVTGVSDQLPIQQQLRMIRYFLPEATRLGILYTSSEANSVASVKRYEELAPRYGFEIVARSISATADLPIATDEILNNVDALTNLTDNTVVNNMQTVLAKANQAGIPYFGSEEEQVRQGLLAAAGLDYFKLGKEAGEMAADILDGDDPHDIDIEAVAKSRIFYNSETLKNLGLTLPNFMRDDDGRDDDWDDDWDDDDWDDDWDDRDDDDYLYIRDVNPVVEQSRGYQPNSRNVERNRYFRDDDDDDDWDDDDYDDDWDD